MTELFAALYLDENVHVLVQPMLRSHGFEARTARDAGNLRRSDEEQLDYAVSNQMAILAHNRVDFEKLHGRYVAEGKEHWGIIITSVHRPQEITERLVLLLNRLTTDEIAGQLLYV